MKAICAILAAVGALQAFLVAAQAETYPSRPITIIVAYPAGGSADVLARAIGQRLSAALHQPVIIENKGGASTQIGAQYVAKSAADGYTLLATDGTTFSNQYLYHKLPYDPDRDFVPVSGLAVLHQALVANPSFPAQTVADLIALAKAKPNVLNYATVGIGSSSHLTMQMLEDMSGIALTPVHYKGGAPALIDVLAGRVPLVFLSLTLTAQPLQTGQLKALAIASRERLARFPKLPTVAETVHGFEAAVWFGLFAPRATPPALVARLNGEVQSIVTDPSFDRDFLEANFYAPLTGSPEDFVQFVRTEEARWGRVIANAKLSLD